MTYHGRKPGRRPSLTRDEVARAAIEEGVTTLTMPGVARRLGVSHSTLYRYVHDRDDLVLAALDLAMREFDWPPADLGWRELLTAFADAMWRFLRQHPGMAEALQCVPGLPATVAELARAYVTRLRSAGLAGRDAAVVVDFVADLTIGTEIGMRGMSKVFDTPRGRRSLREIYRDEWAALADVDPIVLEEATFAAGAGWTRSSPCCSTAWRPSSPRTVKGAMSTFNEPNAPFTTGPTLRRRTPTGRPSSRPGGRSPGGPVSTR